ncbi:hypothetical protein [Eoetvoesiella sp.]|uniref:hypothetical protein n=1 Tax=Eoetvoesiella sp. TaxID=1966355 RepID=UPI0039C8638F
MGKIAMFAASMAPGSRLAASVGALLLSMVLAAPATAGICSAPFMHDGGQAQLSGSGALAMAANLAFSNVSKQGADNCEARVVGDTSIGLMGMPPSTSKLDYWLTVRNGKASFERREADGSRSPVNGKFDLRMLGLFAYGTPVSRQGQTFPALKFQINVDRKAVQADPIVVRTGEKTVGARKTIQTASGSQACWPISYTRVIEATRASFNGLVLPIPAMTSAVTDWFCPALNMVMKQESVQNGVSSTVEVTRIQ